MMTDDDKFFERLRGDARKLRHEPDEATLARIRARIQARLEPSTPPLTVAELLARWFRPLAATAMALALAAAIGITSIDRDVVTFTEDAPEIEMAGDSYRVGE
jgi:hypothetical protein